MIITSVLPLQVQLQNLITSKYIGHFLEEVSLWQKKLSVSDSVISIWFEVQRTWSHLESIFIGSEDIRNQLPEDSKRFDGIDVDFKVRTEGKRAWHRLGLTCGIQQMRKLQTLWIYAEHRFILRSQNLNDMVLNNEGKFVISLLIERYFITSTPKFRSFLVVLSITIVLSFSLELFLVARFLF